MALKNAYSKIPINRIFDLLQKSLLTHGAKQIVFDYGDDGKIYGLMFIIKVGDRFLPIKLPARVSRVKACLQSQGFRYDDEQIYRVAWRNILDWVLAQMAMIDVEMVKLEEIFLPYVVVGNNKTIYEKMVDDKFLLSEGGEKT